MITYDDFKRYENLEEELKSFLIDRCIEYIDAKFAIHFDNNLYYKCNKKYLHNDYEWYEFNDSYIKVYFEEYRTFRDERNQYCYELPLDIVFKPNFKELIIIKINEELEMQRLESIRCSEEHEAELREFAELKCKEEIKSLHMLMQKYPEEVN